MPIPKQPPPFQQENGDDHMDVPEQESFFQSPTLQAIEGDEISVALQPSESDEQQRKSKERKKSKLEGKDRSHEGSVKQRIRHRDGKGFEQAFDGKADHGPGRANANNPKARRSIRIRG